MPVPPSSSLVGSVVERPSGSSLSSKPVPPPSPSGFPSAQHRSKSAFARVRESKRNGTRDLESTRAREVPIVRSSSASLPSNIQASRDEAKLDRAKDELSKDSNSKLADEEEWKAQMRRDNERTVAAMSEEERERHATEILEQLGTNVAELLRKAREAHARPGVEPEEKSDAEPRGRDKNIESSVHRDSGESSSNGEIGQPKPITPAAKHKFASPPRGILSQPTSRSSSPGRSSRKLRLRFADITPKDVHIFQSEPSSPRKPIGLLLPASSEQPGTSYDVQTISGAHSESRTLSGQAMEPEEGTPEYIRRHFFPDAPADNPALEWIEPNNSADTDLDSGPRFDLSGAIIPASLQMSLPTHLGLHHHGGSSAAGYTLSNLFLLARSSVPAQRATILGVLSKILRRLAKRESEVSDIKDRESVRSKALVLGLAAITEKGTVGMQAIELVWICVVYWDEDEVAGINGAELRPVNARLMEVGDENRQGDSLPLNDPISSLPFSALLPQIAMLLDDKGIPPESELQLLALLHRFARHSVEIATAVCETPHLVASVLNTFLLTPIPPSECGPVPDPLALEFLRTLAVSSRSNARSLVGPGDALLRFITTSVPPSNSPFPPPLAEALLHGTLNLYTALGKYGLYSGIATTAAEHFNRLSSTILRTADVMSVDVKVSWLRLLSVWMVCARDPHRTTPTHDLLWSQVTGWAWGEDVLELRKSLLPGETGLDVRLCGAVWDSLASWLEGSRINSTKAGEGERDAVNVAMEFNWVGGIEQRTISRLVAELQRAISMSSEKEVQPQQRRSQLSCVAETCEALASFARLCLSCLPKPASTSADEATRMDIPSWIVNIVPVLATAASPLVLSDHFREIRRRPTEVRDDLSFRHKVTCLQPASSFLASFAKLSRLLLSFTNRFAKGLAILQTLLPGDEESAERLIGTVINEECANIECANKLQFLVPFFRNLIRPDDKFYLSPLSPTPESIQRSTTQCLPADCVSHSSARSNALGLPLSVDWPCITLDHLLRSGTSPILTNPDSVPESWNASETDLVQASLSLMLLVQRTLSESTWRVFAPTFEHVVFNCMKVFMLEHNQQQSDTNEEVFRDSTVGRLMDALLEPYTLRSVRSTVRTDFSPSNLEVVAKDFLGEGTPFFQFYTDFVALYDAVSFSYPTFARLLLPPTSMLYDLDYRKLLWGDYGHDLRTIRVPAEDVPSPNLKQFLWPVETDAEMLGWYLRALVKWTLDGFVRFVAVHHVASNIWSDLRQAEETNAVQEKRARMLLVALFNQAESEVVRDVVQYEQGGDDAIGMRLSPACYECKRETKLARIEFVRKLGESWILEGMEKIYSE